MSSSTSNQSEDFISISDLIHLCVSRWRWFVVSFFLCLGYAGYYLAKTPNTYTGRAAVLIKQESTGNNAGHSSSVIDFKDVGLLQQTSNTNDIQRQMTSLAVLIEAARILEMADTEEKLISAAKSLQARVTVVVEKESNILTLEVTDRSPRRAEQILSAVIDAFNSKWISDRNLITASTTRFIDERLALLELDLGNVDDSISNYKSRNQITDISRVSELYLQQQNSSEAQIFALSNQKQMAQYILGILTDKSTQRQLLPTNSGINNSVAEAQITTYNSMLLELKNNMYSTSGQNPVIRKQESDLVDLRKNIIATIKNQIKALDIQLQTYMGANGEATSKIAKSPGQAKHLLSVEREQKVKENLYIFLLQKREESVISMTYSTDVLQVLDFPFVGNSPTAPSRVKILFAAMMLGLLIPVVLAFVISFTDKTVRGRSDVVGVTDLVLLGQVPQYMGVKGKKNVRAHIRNTIARPKFMLMGLVRKFIGLPPMLPSPLVVKSDHTDKFNEAFRIVRNNLEVTYAQQGQQNVYAVTSYYLGSGTTFVSINLAQVLVVSGKRVLLIDGDLRKASVSHSFQAFSTFGLADYLAGNETLPEPVQEGSPMPINILPVGTMPTNPTELLSSERFENLLEAYRSQYDYIIIDCPPSGDQADADIICRKADNTLFILRKGLFKRDRIAELEDDVRSSKYHHLSLILNGV